MKSVNRTLLGIAVLVAATTSITQVTAQVRQVAPAANNWAQALFNKDRIDFGVIARGSDARQTVQIQNTTRSTIHINNVRTTCGCSAAKPSQELLNPGEIAIVEVTMDTRKFTRKKDSNVIVTFDQPSVTSVTIPITSYIRTDVVFTPGSIVFGKKEVGEGDKKTISIAYAGRADWKIREVKSSSKYIKASVRETNRDPRGSVGYALDVELDSECPAGRIQHVLTLVTDDSNNPYVPVLVSGAVETDIVVSPGTLDFGKHKAGEKVTKKVIIRGKEAIQITGIEVDSEFEDFKVRMPKEIKKIHILPLTYVTPDRPGKWTEEFLLTIEGRPEPLKFKATGENR